jgi:hypothetical protein
MRFCTRASEKSEASTFHLLVKTLTLPSIGGVLLSAFLLQLNPQVGAAERWLNHFDSKASFLAATNSDCATATVVYK